MPPDVGWLWHSASCVRCQYAFCSVTQIWCGLTRHHRLCRSVHEFIEPYTFPSYHMRILEPYNYYEFGQNYVRTLINFETSVVSMAGHLLLCLLRGYVAAECLRSFS